MNEKYENAPRKKSIEKLILILRLHCKFSSFREIDKTEAIFRSKPDATCLLDHITQRIVITILIPIPILSEHTNQGNNDSRATERKTKTNRKNMISIFSDCVYGADKLLFISKI